MGQMIDLGFKKVLKPDQWPCQQCKEVIRVFAIMKCSSCGHHQKFAKCLLGSCSKCNSDMKEFECDSCKNKFAL